MKWGQLTGTTSVVALDSALATPEHSSADIRELVFYEVLSPLITLKAALNDSDEDTGSELLFFGTDAEAQASTNRRLAIADVEPQEVAVQSVGALAPLDFGRACARSNSTRS